MCRRTMCDPPKKTNIVVCLSGCGALYIKNVNHSWWIYTLKIGICLVSIYRKFISKLTEFCDNTPIYKGVGKG